MSDEDRARFADAVAGVTRFAELIQRERPDLARPDLGRVFITSGLGLINEALGARAAVDYLRWLAADLERAAATAPAPGTQTN